ncbi:MAG: hypothetical protein JWL86_638 [Rhizobium sp.]|nr:hypothetical protein [Rhizobium sp.]
MMAFAAPAKSNSQIADDSRPAVTAAGDAIPPSLCSPAAVLNSVAAGSCRGAPALLGVSSLTSAALDPSPVVRAGSGAADFSDCEPFIDEIERRAWLQMPGASALMRKNANTFFVAADNVIQFASRSSNIPTTWNIRSSSMLYLCADRLGSGVPIASQSYDRSQFLGSRA